jgi:HJR/Mrr/RecB family endonuclease
MLSLTVVKWHACLVKHFKHIDRYTVRPYRLQDRLETVISGFQREQYKLLTTAGDVYRKLRALLSLFKVQCPGCRCTANEGGDFENLARIWSSRFFKL